MKINAKLISEKVDHYIDLISEGESDDDPEELREEKEDLNIKEYDDLDEELKYLEDDIDSEKDLDIADGGGEENSLDSEDNEDTVADETKLKEYDKL